MTPEGICACRIALQGRLSPQAGGAPSNAGLLLSRYLQQTGDKGAGKGELLKKAVAASRQADGVYREAYKRWRSYLDQLPEPTVKHDFKVKGRMIVGLGGASVLETGVTLHHTYGVPFIPGSALKGLAAHYCAQIWGAAEASEFGREVPLPDPPGETRLGQYYETLFGATDDSGHLVFHDAWLVPEPAPGALQLDVMTPHHPKYYGADPKDEKEAPTDFDDPNPVAFLSVKGEFLVAVSCDVEGEEGKKWAALGMELLTQALAEWGIGGKTNAGYGRLELVESSTPTDAPAPTNSPTSNTAAANKQEKKGKNRKK
jgi:CRISPR-associated protein Cmr6